MTNNPIEKVVLLPFPAANIYNLVERIEDYPGFLPWCAKTEVDRSEADAIRATVKIDYLGIRQSFTTRNRHTASSRIDMVLLDGPFTALDGCWLFHELRDDACKVEFSLDYTMRSGLFGRAMAPVFGKISASMVDAFVNEAHKRYG